jgi:hypothetical protein
VKKPTLKTILLAIWTVFTICLISICSILYIENQDIKTVPVFIYAGPTVPQDIVAKINLSIDNVDEKKIEEWYKDRVYDKDFQMAMFYSYLSTALAEKILANKFTTYQDLERRDASFKKSLDLWGLLIKKDEDLAVFRDCFIKRYREVLKNNQ